MHRAYQRMLHAEWHCRDDDIEKNGTFFDQVHQNKLVLATSVATVVVARVVMNSLKLRVEVKDAPARIMVRMRLHFRNPRK